jgi:hypothetical protein
MPSIIIYLLYSNTSYLSIFIFSSPLLCAKIRHTAPHETKINDIPAAAPAPTGHVDFPQQGQVEDMLKMAVIITHQRNIKVLKRKNIRFTL